MRTVGFVAPEVDRISRPERLAATLVEGALPEGVREANVRSDAECMPDEAGVSHCINRLQVGEAEVTVQHHYEMYELPCLMLARRSGSSPRRPLR